MLLSAYFCVLLFNLETFKFYFAKDSGIMWTEIILQFMQVAQLCIASYERIMNSKKYVFSYNVCSKRTVEIITR